MMERHEMATITPDVKEFAAQVQSLPFGDRVRLISLIAESLLSAERPSPHQMTFGQFRGEQMSTEEDFAIAEWHPSENELNVN